MEINNKEIKPLNVGDVVEINGNIYQIITSKWASRSQWDLDKLPSNEKGNFTGIRLILKKMKTEDLTKWILNKEEIKQ
jgi:hypothetical protein